MMRFLPTNQIWRYWGFEVFLSDMESLGVRDVDLWLCNSHANIDATETYNARAVDAALRRHGVRVSTLTPEQGNPKAYNVASLDADIRRLTLAYYRQILRLAERLGAKRLSINAGWHALDEEPARVWDATVGTLGSLCDMAAEAGVRVCCETLARKPYRLVTDAKSLACLLQDVGSPNLYATLDTGTIARNGENLDSYAKALEGRIGYVHLTNLDPDVFAHLAWGDKRGRLDPEHLLGALEKIGYEGDVALEMTHSPYFSKPRDVLSRSLRILKGCER